jgi:hypothetical protein
MKDKPSPEQQAQAEDLQSEIDDLVAGRAHEARSLREFADQFQRPTAMQPDAPPKPKRPRKGKNRH